MGDIVLSIKYNIRNTIILGYKKYNNFIYPKISVFHLFDNTSVLFHAVLFISAYHANRSQLH